MNEQDVKNVALNTFQEQMLIHKTISTLVPSHYHNGVDSPIIPMRNYVQAWLTGTEPQTAGNYSIFFTFPYKGIILGITEVHSVAGTDAGAVTLQVEKLTGTQASGAGINLLSSAFNLKATANTVQVGKLNFSPNNQFNIGDRLGLVLTGTPTSLTNLVIIVQTQTI